MTCKPLTRLMFIGMWNFADDYGRMLYAPLSIKAKVFPNDAFAAADIKDMLSELNGIGLLLIYSAKDKEYIEITGWEHQKIDKRQVSKIPGPFEVGSCVKDGSPPTSADLPRLPPTPAPVMEGNGEEGKGREDVVVDARGKSVFREADFELTDRIMRAWGLHEADPRISGTTYFANKWLISGWQADVIVATIERVMAKRDKPPNNLRYFEQAIADAHAEIARPVPEGSATGPPSRRRRTFADLTMDLENRINERSDADPAGKFIVIDGTADAPADGEPVSEADVARQRAQPG